MASTVWSVQIRLLSTSNVGATLGKISTAARTADRAVLTLNTSINLLTRNIQRVPLAADKLMASFDVMRATGVGAFSATSRSAAGFSRTTIAAGDVASRSMAGVSRSLTGVRMSANAATAAVNTLSLASRRVPAVRGAAAEESAALGGGGLINTGAFALAAGGAIAGGALLSGVKGAGDVQQLQAQLRVAGMNAAQANAMHDVALKMSTMTAQSVSDSMNLLKVMATSGVPLSGLGTLAMPIARYADVNYLATGKKHVEFEQSAIIASGLAHDLQIYDPARMGSFLDTLYKASYQSGHGPELMATQMRYYAARAKSAGMSDEDIVNVYPLIDRFGLGAGRGGSGVNMLLKNIQDPRGKTKQRALDMMGFYKANGENRFIDPATGDIDLMGPNGVFAYVAKWRTKMHLEKKGALANVLESRGFDTNAANVLEAVGTPGGMEQLRRIRAGEAKMPGLQKAQEMLMSGLNSQTKLLSSNFHTLMTEIANPLLPQLTQLVTNLALLTGNLASFMHAHPGAAKATAYGLGAVAVAGGIAGLSLGGLIAAGAIRGAVGPALRFFGAHGAVESVAHGAAVAGIHARSGAAITAGRGTRLVGNLLGLGAVKSVGRVFAPIMEELTLLHARSITGSLGLKMLGEGALRIGSKAIPVVGEILLLVDTLTFLGTHSKDIGYLVGRAFVWMMRNIPNIVRGGTGLAVDAMKGLIGEIIGVLNPANWVKTIGGFISGIQSAVDDANAKTVDGRRLGGAPLGLPTHARSNVPGHPTYGLHLPNPHAVGPRVGMATGGRVLSNGMAYLHRNEVVVNDRLTRRLDSLTQAPGRASSQRTIIFKHELTIRGNGRNQFDGIPHRDLKKLSRMIAGALGEDVELDSRAGGAIPQLAGASHYSVSKGKVT